jgi:hypothetical protein
MLNYCASNPINHLMLNYCGGLLLVVFVRVAYLVGVIRGTR